jgi:tryptophan synthase alpha chain
VELFDGLRAEGKQTLVPFLTAGYPDLDATVALLKDFEARGLKVCELGIPYSDPIADGPVIQASYTEALARGVTAGAIFDAVRRYRREGGGMALVAMVSYSIVFRHGVEQYFADARDAGFDAMIIPDLPMEEEQRIEPVAARHGLANILLIAPTSSKKRKLQIASCSRGFIYYMSIAGITGERDRLPPATISAVTELRKHTPTPICVGFGISNAATVAEVCKAADGAIVGSAIMHRVSDAAAKNLGRDEMVRRVGGFVGELLAPLQ